jgi:hypothetical protein
MAMYVELLSILLMTDHETAARESAELLALVQERRNRMLTSCSRPGQTVEWNLACDADYDCALIRLCATLGIDAGPTSFGQPREARSRLEQALTEVGVDLQGLPPALADLRSVPWGDGGPPRGELRTRPPPCDCSS